MVGLFQIFLLGFANCLLATPVCAEIPSCSPDSATVDSVERAAGEFEFSSRGGVRLEVYCSDHTMLYGDLLSVSDSSISVYAYADFSASPFGEVRTGSHAINLHGIERIVLKGQSRILQGVFAGFLGGMIVGVIITTVAEQRTPSNQRLGPAAFGGIGLLAGSAAGYVRSGSDLEIKTFNQYELAFLRTMSRSDRGSNR